MYDILCIVGDVVKKKKIKLKKNVINVLKIVGIFVVLVFVLYFLYLKQINAFTSLGYSKVASKNILFSGNKEYVLSIGKNDTLNAAFESVDYDENNLSNYAKIHIRRHSIYFFFIIFYLSHRRFCHSFQLY